MPFCSASAADYHKACSGLLEARDPSSRTAAFNLLATQRVLLLVPRSRERYGPVACNAVAFAGTLLVRSTEELDFVRSTGPMKILKEVTLPWEG